MENALVFGQDNISRTGVRGLVRGLHFQRPPHARHKLDRVVQGRVLNVVVDLRLERFGAVHTCELDADLGAWIYIPAGFAHGFQALEDRAEIHCNGSGHFAPAAVVAVRFDDPMLAIDWSLICPQELPSTRNRKAAALEDARQAFHSGV
jgi:dTDP-4-dehydrorhamnose 3,5-epimerase